MLRQILRELRVEPEVLAELDEAQRAALFCRMREEQVRRWAERERAPAHAPAPAPSDAADARPRRPGAKKRVDWLLGADGEPWVWVMGEHPDDLSVDEILARERRANQAPLALAEAETDEELEDEEEEEEGEEEGPNARGPQPPPEASSAPASAPGARQEGGVGGGEEGVYCSVDELRPFPLDDPADKRGALQEISLNMRQAAGAAAAAAASGRAEEKAVAQRVALWERRVAEERGLHARPQRRRREPSARLLREGEQRDDEERAWREQERKAKEAEQQIREIARRAREEHRRASVLAMEVEPAPGAPPPAPDAAANSNLNDSSGVASSMAKPPSTEAVVQWFRSSEIARRAGLAPGTSLVATWFHGLISRQEAETLLESAPVGSFLVRISERVWGYAISFRGIDRCKHFLIDASSGHYQFLGANQLSHSSLGELVEYHASHPITILGGERLLHPCARSELPPIFQGLLTASAR